MGLLAWWKRIRASNRFDPERAAGRMPAVTIRPLRDEDIPVCHAIYKANEEGRFPDNYFGKFEADLESDGYLWLVVEDADEIVAVGGVCLHEYKSGTLGFLAFGMVTPDIGDYMYELLDRNAPVVEIPQAYHHMMLDQPLALVSAFRTLLADWEHSVPRRSD